MPSPFRFQVPHDPHSAYQSLLKRRVFHCGWPVLCGVADDASLIREETASTSRAVTHWPGTDIDFHKLLLPEHAQQEPVEINKTPLQEQSNDLKES